MCPGNSLVYNHPKVALEWDTEANAPRMPETVTSSNSKVSLDRWPMWAQMERSNHEGAGCPDVLINVLINPRRQRMRQPSISNGAPHLLAEWDYDANEQQDWHPDRTSLTYS